MTEPMNATDRAARAAARKNVLVVAGVFVTLVLAGPLIFYAFQSNAASGFFAFISDNFWATVPILVLVLAAIWLPILWLGARLDKAHLEKEQAERTLGKDTRHG